MFKDILVFSSNSLTKPSTGYLKKNKAQFLNVQFRSHKLFIYHIQQKPVYYD